jgi:hypothetical protein
LDVSLHNLLENNFLESSNIPDAMVGKLFSKLRGLSTRSLQPYTYEALPEEGFIRLLRLLPGSPEDALTCSLFMTKLEEAPSYEAISYVWGLPDTGSCTMKCEDDALQITNNLHGALRRMRKDSEERVLWADAVCIDQKNLLERGHQVDLMGRIFQSASRVLIWLGEDTDGNAEIAVSLIMELNQYFGKHYLELGNIGDVPLITPDSPLLELSKWHAIEHLLDRPWFSRVWVLQEVGLAATAVAFCGNSRIDWSEIVQFACLDSNRPDFDDCSAEVGPVGTGRIYLALVSLWCSYSSSRSWIDEQPFLQYIARQDENVAGRDLFYILCVGAYYKATDPRDRVFAFLGHPSAHPLEGDQPLLVADYTTDSRRVFLEAAAAMLENMKSLILLSAVVHSEDDLETDYPSWVPKWDPQSNLCPPSPEIKPYYDAALCLEHNPGFVVQRGNPDDPSLETFLQVRGIIFDSVKLFSQTLNTGDLCRKSGTQMNVGGELNPIESAWMVASEVEDSQYPDKELAFIQTIALGPENSPLTVKQRVQALSQANFRAYCLQNFTPELCSKEFKEEVTVKGEGRSSRYYFSAYCVGRKFFVTSKGFYGVGASVMKQGDLCCVLFGAYVPFIIRPTGTKSKYKLVGECYIQGVMRGEVVRKWKEGKFHDEDILLV